MLRVALKNLFKKPSTLIKKPKVPEGFRGFIKIDEKKCIGCGLCVKVCPARALEMKNKKVKYKKELCIFCGFCAEICPVKAITITKDYEEEIK